MKDVSSYIQSDELERAVLAYWEEQHVFEQSLEKTKDGPAFTFYDGPPYATGKPHYGHVLQSAIKDTVLRYKTMQGFSVPRKVGWDCHGLPVEVLVEKELGLKTKQDIEALGIEAFNAKCREVVTRYVDDFTTTLKRLGRWASYEQAYKTLEPAYMNTEWGVFKQLWEKDLVYKAFRTTPYCIRCATPLSNFEVSSNYKDKYDQALYVLLPIRGIDKQYLLIWTTTSWTLPGNAAVAFNPAITYVSVEQEGKEVILAKDRVAAVFGEEKPTTKTWTADEMSALTYEPLYTFISAENAYRVVAADYVSATDGSGLVHTAPAFGEDDSQTGKKHNLPLLRTVDTRGNFIPEVTTWAGQNIFDAAKLIAKDLKERGLLFKQETFKHSYPFCWRCDTPLIYYALDSWFVRIEKIKEKMIAAGNDIHWIPEHVKTGRFGKGIESAPDWAVSRNRFWSVPIPVWECDGCHERVCVGSTEELQTLSGGEELPDMHRPYVDAVMWQCAACQKGTMKRIEEVLDVWFDAGSMPYATHAHLPADFIVENIEQTRLWFYVLHVLAVALHDSSAYKNVVASGTIFAEDGQKLSKKLKNYPDVEPTMEKYGADTLRFYLLASSSLGEPYYFSEKRLKETRQNSYVRLWNVYSFFVNYAKVYGFSPPAGGGVGEVQGGGSLLDLWISARLKQLEHEVISAMDSYHVDDAARLFIPFIDDLSNWYVRRSRDRFQPSSATDSAAFETLYEVLVRLSKLLAPFMPFVAEEMYRNLTERPSVHLEQLAKPEALSVDEEVVLKQMQQARLVVNEALGARAAAKLKVRQPLAMLSVLVKDGEELPPELLGLIRDEVNVKEVRAVNDQASLVVLDTQLTPELKSEGMARELIRFGQSLRKEAGFALNDRITLLLQTSDDELKQIITTQKDVILQALQADALVESGDMDKQLDVELDGKKVLVGVKK